MQGVGAEAAVEHLLLEGRLAAAIAGVDAWRADESHPDPSRRRFAAGVFALGGRDRALAACADPSMLTCTAEEMEQFLRDAGATLSHDYLSAGVILSWANDARGAYAFLRTAHERALTEQRAGFAVGALERLAHHALLFGDATAARAAIEEAAGLAAVQSLPHWRLRCIAASAGLALAVGEADVAAAFLDEAREAAPALETLALFAPTGAQLTASAEDVAGVAYWTSPAMLDVALHSYSAESAIAATTACLLAGNGPPAPGAPEANALRRALLQAENAAVAPEFYSTAARCGDSEHARLAVRCMRATVAPNRRYLEAHRLLAEAHLRFRFGERTDAIDSASDAARAFDAIGMRRWTNEAMLLLVHQERSPDPPRRRRPTALSLTQREQQVAHLIRRGASNREVAHTLQISEHTVERHVSSILSRLGLRSRWQIVDAPSTESRH